ncbi:MAG: copper amine oxidase N-terminal domain-containing protein [Defluviitaleaceae bacterium]|nr:copper amine oxidase N-terminal domain-containing protein [Defluviitaleaceae bacterium]
MKGKRLLGFGLAVVLILSGIVFSRPAATVHAETNVSVVLDGAALSFDVPPQIINDRVMVPFRAIAEAMGAKVSWDQGMQMITMELNDKFVMMTVGNSTMWYGDHRPNPDQKGGLIAYEMDSPPVIVDGRTLVPIRAIAEALGAEVGWDAETETVTITSAAIETASPEPTPTMVPTPSPTPTPTATPTPSPLLSPVPSPTPEIGVYDVGNIHIQVDSNNPYKARATLSGLSPEIMECFDDGTIEIEFSTDGKTVGNVGAGFIYQGNSPWQLEISDRLRWNYISVDLVGVTDSIISGVSLWDNDASIVAKTDNSVTWEFEVSKDVIAGNLKDIIYLGYAYFYSTSCDYRAYAYTGGKWDDLGETYLYSYLFLKNK